MSQLNKVGFVTVAGGEQIVTVSSFSVETELLFLVAHLMRQWMAAYDKMCEAQEKDFRCFIISVWSLVRYEAY